MPGRMVCFETLAPERLVRKINTLRGRLQFLYEGAPYSPALLDNQHPPDGAPEPRKHKIAWPVWNY